MSKVTTLAYIGKARQQLALATKIDDVKEIRDKAEALRLYAKQTRESLAGQNQFAEIKIRAERKGGEILKGMEKHKGGRPSENRSHDATSLSDIGLNKSQSSRWQAIAGIPEDKFEEYIAKTKAADKELTSSGTHKEAKKGARETAEEPHENLNPVPSVICEDAFDWLGRVEDGYADLLLTDPPYSTDLDDVELFASRWIPLALKKLKPTGRAYICIGAYPKELYAYLALAEWDQVLVWTYRNTLGPSPKHRYKLNWQAILYFCGPKAPPLNCPVMTEQFSVFDINAPDARHEKRYHSWQKPDELGERIIKQATQKKQIVIDPFAGTGSFLLAAGRLGRVGIGCDSDRKQIAVAIGRGCRAAEDWE